MDARMRQCWERCCTFRPVPQCPQLVVGAIVEFRHEYDQDEGINGMSRWKQGVVKHARLHDAVIDVIHSNGIKETRTADKAYIRQAKMLVREVGYKDEFHHLKGKSHGQVFASTCVISPECAITAWRGRGDITLVMSIGIETDIVGGSVHSLGSGYQEWKNHLDDSEISGYLSRMNLQYVMEDYARLSTFRAARKRDNQVDLMTELFDAWAPAGQRPPRTPNEVLTNLHPDMIFGVLVSGFSDDLNVALACSEFEQQFGRQLETVSIENGFFVVHRS